MSQNFWRGALGSKVLSVGTPRRCVAGEGTVGSGAIRRGHRMVNTHSLQ